MSDLTKKILTRGYIRVEIRPTRFISGRVPYGRLEAILTETQVQLGGWEYPHVGQHNEIQRGKDWVGSETKWEHRLESVRLYQSGLFVDIRGFGWDWRDESGWWPKDDSWQPNTALSVTDTIHVLQETYLFAGRLSATEAGDDRMHLNAILGNLTGRELIVDPRRVVFFQPYKTQMPSWDIDLDYDKIELASRGPEIALEQATDLFKRFGWQTTPALLKELGY